LLDVVSIADASPLRRVALFARAIRGAHLSSRGVESMRAASFRMEFDAAPAFEADGELHRARGCVVTIGCRPGALHVIGP
jgi:diacylglycerol kinase family enzyme